MPVYTEEEVQPSFTSSVKEKGKGKGGISEKGKGKRDKVTDKPTCPWVLHISKCPKEETWMVKTFKNEHKCLQTRDVAACTASFLSKEIEQLVIPNPTIPIKAIQDQLQKKFEVGMSTMKIYRAKSMAVKRVLGDYVHQYTVLRDYACELQKTNPGTTVKLDVENEENADEPTRQFKRIYICIGSLKEGFKRCLRDILGLDGCFMKGPYPGQILTAVGIDPNNGIYPLAFAVVEAETRDSWEWFLNNLADDLDLYRNSNFTFISDRQKGIIPAIQKLFPHAEHRFCLRHIHENMKAQWKGQAYKDLIWKAATATTIPQFQAAMDQLRVFNDGAYRWLNSIPPQHWSRAYFSGRCGSDVLLNNMCEVFNRQLVDGRDMPIITCLEYIRTYMMKRIVNVQKVIEKSEGPLTPNATKLLDSIKHEAASYIVEWNGGHKYQVSGPWQDQCVVDMNAKVCTCRRWELTGIPCKHVVATIWNMALNGAQVGLPEAWVHKCYLLDTWKTVYQYKIDPISGSQMWPKSEYPTTLKPPKHHTPIGRPRKLRRKSVDEMSQPMVRSGKISRGGKTVTCTKCHQIGHNARTCKGQQKDSTSQVENIGGRHCSKCRAKGHNVRSCTAEVLFHTADGGQSQEGQ